MEIRKKLTVPEGRGKRDNEGKKGKGPVKGYI